MATRNIIDILTGKIALRYLPPQSIVPSNIVLNPLTSDIMGGAYAMKNMGTVNTILLETDVISLSDKIGQTWIESLDSVQFAPDKQLRFQNDISIESLEGGNVIINAIPAATTPQQEFVCYDTITNKLYHQTLSPSGVSGLAAGTNINIDNTNPAIPIISVLTTLSDTITFTNPPECAIQPTSNNMLVNKAYADSLVGGTVKIDPINYTTLNPPSSFLSNTIYKIEPLSNFATIELPIGILNMNITIKNTALIGGFTLTVKDSNDLTIVNIIGLESVFIIFDGINWITI